MTNINFNTGFTVNKLNLKHSLSSINNEKHSNKSEYNSINTDMTLKSNLDQLYFLGISQIKRINTDLKNEKGLIDYVKYLSTYENAYKLITNENQLKDFFSNDANIISVENNEIANNNFHKAIISRASQELQQLESLKTLTPQETEKVQYLKDTIELFSIPSQQANSNNITFKSGKGISIGVTIKQSPQEFKGITQEQYNWCHGVIHTTAALCGTTSYAWGEGAAVGADTPFLRGMQSIMFGALALILNVPAVPSGIYASKEIFSGIALGSGGAKVLISWLGIGAHGASSGTASGVITTGVRSVNSALSGSITEKMGWGYVKSVEKNRMNVKDQLIDTATTLAIPKLSECAIDGISDQLIHNSKNLFNSIPKENVKTLGRLMEVINQCHGDTISKAFASSLLSRFSENALKGKKETLQEAIQGSIITALAYDVTKTKIDAMDKHSLESVESAAKQIKTTIESTPEIYKEFTKLSEMNYKRLSSYTVDIDLSKDQIDNITEFSSKFIEKYTKSVEKLIKKKT